MLGRALPLKDENGAIVRWFGTCTDIHDAVEARAAARRLREQLLRVIEHAHVTLWVVDQERKLTFLEGSLMWDTAENDINEGCIGKNIYEVFGRHKGAEEIPFYKAPIESILEGNTTDETIETHIDGNGRWYRTRFVPLRRDSDDSDSGEENVVDGVIGVSIDVTGMCYSRFTACQLLTPLQSFAKRSMTSTSREWKILSYLLMQLRLRRRVV